MSKKFFALLAAILLLPAFIATADAAPHRKSHYSKSYHSGQKSAHRHASHSRRASSSRRAASRRYAARSERSRYRRDEASYLGYTNYSSASYSSRPRSSGVGGRPSRWCGRWMRTQRGGGPEMNLAWNWSKYGSPAAPQVGAVVVWRHHVGQIVGQAANGKWLVQSGNDGNAVRTRARSISGAVIRM